MCSGLFGRDALVLPATLRNGDTGRTSSSAGGGVAVLSVVSCGPSSGEKAAGLASDWSGDSAVVACWLTPGSSDSAGSDSSDGGFERKVPSTSLRTVA